MSLINDALKRAQKAPPVITSASVPPPPPTQPAAHNPVSVTHWLIPAVIILLVAAATFFIGWGMAHHSLTRELKLVESKPVAAAVLPTPSPGAETTNPPASAPASVPAPVQPPQTMSVNPLFGPKLQGIFYSPTDPTAILDGKTVHVGDHFKSYRVAKITPTSVILRDSDNETVKVVMHN